MGLFSGSNKTTTSEKSDTGPSSFQRPYLDETFGAAKSIYDNAQGTPYYQGDTYAGMSPDAKAQMDKLRGYATTTGLGTATTLSSIGSGLVGNFGKAAGAIDEYSAMARQDPTKANIASAQQYADTPYLQGQIDANARDVTRNLTEQQLPGIDRAASGTGNINSSRAGIAAGVARRGAEDRIGDISATMRGDAYSKGLSMAQQDRQTNMSALGTAANGYGSLAGAGIDAIGQGTQAGYGAFDAINKSYGTEQLDQQGEYDAAFKAWQGGDTRAMDLLARYGSVVGSNQWGQSGTSSGTSTQKSSGSALGQIMGAASTAASIYTGMR